MIGKTILHYKILERLGEGGMGEVYKALDLQLDRIVAIKILPKDAARDREARERFIREAKAASASSHAHITTIYEIAEWEGQYLLVMEYVDGKTLDEMLEDGPLPVEQVVDIAIQTAQALSAAHERGIVHRDVKSDNIMLDARGQVKVTDFGLAKMKSATKLTMPDSTVGTPSYMSPEQATGRNVDHRSDIFSLGVVMYEVLTGELPFQGERSDSILYAVVNSTPKPISELRKGVPQELIDIVDIALQKDVGSRYQSVQEMIDDLQRVKESLEGKRRTKRSSKTLGAYKRQRKLGRILIPGIALVVLTAAVLTWMWQFGPLRTIATKRILVVPFGDETVEKEFSQYNWTLARALSTSLEQSQSLEIIPPLRLREILQLQNFDLKRRLDLADLQQVAKTAECHLVIVPSVSRLGRNILFDSQIFETRPWHQVATVTGEGQSLDDFPGMIDSLTQRIFNRLDPALSSFDESGVRPFRELSTNSMEAYRYFVAGEESIDDIDLVRAEMCFEKSLEIDSTFASSYALLAHVYYNLGKQDEAKEAITQARHHSAGLPENEKAYINLLDLYISGKPEELLSCARELPRLYPHDHRILENCGDALWMLGEMQLAEDTFLQLKRVSPERAYVYEALGQIALETRRWDEALRYFDQQVQMWPMLCNAHKSLGEYFFIRGLFDEALSEFQEAEVLRPGSCNHYVGGTYMVKGMYERALQHFRTAAAAATEPRRIAVAYWGISRIYSNRRQYQLALGECQNGLSHVGRASALLLQIGQIHLREGRVDLARETLARMKVECEKSPNTFLLEGMILLREGDTVGGVAALAGAERALRMLGWFPLYCFLTDIGMTYVSSELWEEAKRTFSDLIDIFPGYPIGYYGLGKCCLHERQENKALQYFEQALKAWKEATEDIVELVDTRREVALLTRPSTS